MAFNLAGTAATGSPDLAAFFPGAAAPVSVRGLPDSAPHATIAARNETDGVVPTVNMFLDAADQRMGYAASIIDLCDGATTYALRCTSGPAYLPSSVCGFRGAQEVTLTANPTTYRVSMVTAARTAGQDVRATVHEHCRLAGTTEAACTATVGGAVDGQSAALSTTETLRGADVWRFDVAVTGGAEKLANPTACAGPAKGESGAGGVRAGPVWGVLGGLVVGVVVMLV